MQDSDGERCEEAMAHRDHDDRRGCWWPRRRSTAAKVIVVYRDMPFFGPNERTGQSLHTGGGGPDRRFLEPKLTSQTG